MTTGVLKTASELSKGNKFLTLGFKGEPIILTVLYVTSDNFVITEEMGKLDIEQDEYYVIN